MSECPDACAVPFCLMLMDRTVRLVDDSVKDEVLRFPTVAMIRKLFPDVKMRGRSVMCNPLRGEKNASLSCFIDRYGYPRWKDHATGESGDNIDFFRKAYPELDYSDAVDRLSWIVLGRSALLDVDPLRERPVFVSPRRRPVHVKVQEPESALKIVSVSPLVPVRAARVSSLIGAAAVSPTSWPARIAAAWSSRTSTVRGTS